MNYSVNSISKRPQRHCEERSNLSSKEILHFVQNDNRIGFVMLSKAKHLGNIETALFLAVTIGFSFIIYNS